MTKWYDVPSLLTELTQCIADKWSARQAAARISDMAGYPVSRNALIGKARRDHLGRFQSEGDGNYQRAPKKPRRQRESKNPAQFTNIKPAPIPLPPESPMQADFLCVPFDALERDMCRFPAGDGPYVYCGQPVWNETSYCAWHQRLTHSGYSTK